MAELARRTGYGQGSDVVRRLIARPIRVQARMTAEPAAAPPAPVEVAPQPAAALQKPNAMPTEETPPEADPARLEVEMMVLKAVLRAERRENASLRACVGFDEAGEALGRDARAVRDRWATLVDRLLHPVP